MHGHSNPFYKVVSYLCATCDLSPKMCKWYSHRCWWGADSFFCFSEFYGIKTMSFPSWVWGWILGRRPCGCQGQAVFLTAVFLGCFAKISCDLTSLSEWCLSQGRSSVIWLWSYSYLKYLQDSEVQTTRKGTFGEAGFPCLPPPPLICDCFHSVWVYSPVFLNKGDTGIPQLCTLLLNRPQRDAETLLISHFWGRCSIPGHILFSHQSAPDAGRGWPQSSAVANSPSECC